MNVLKQSNIIMSLNVQLPIEGESKNKFAQRVINERISFLKKYLEKTGLKGFTLGISGGVDSFVSGMLAKKTGYELCLISMPFGIQDDFNDVEKCINIIDPQRCYVHNIESSELAYQKMNLNIEDDINNQEEKLILGNIKARYRMLVQYSYAQKLNHLVIGTDHATEAVTGYYTKYGDGAADILPLAGLTKDVIYEMAKILGAPENVLSKKPSAGLWEGQSDEDELGISYEEIIKFLKGEEISEEMYNKIFNMYNMTKHKRQLPISPTDTWWLTFEEN